MARPKPKHPKVNIKITITDILYEAARYDIENLSAYVQKCLVSHVAKLMRENPDARAELLEKYGNDIIYIMRSCKAKGSPTLPNNKEKVSILTDYDLTDEGLNSLLEGL